MSSLTITRPAMPVPVPLSRGGTEATTPAGARAKLELGDLAQLTAPGGTSTFLRADKTWAVPPGGGGGGGDVSSSTALSVDTELVVFDGTTGKLLKRGTGTGLALLTNGVLSMKAAPTGAVVGTTDTQTLTGKTISGAANTLTVRDLDLAFTDVTTANVSTTAHGLTPKAPGGTTQFLRGDATWAVPAGGGGGAPTDAEYITSTAHASLSAERVLTDTATITWDRATAGQIKANAIGGGYTDEQAQDAIGAMLLDTATIDLTYTDATPALSATVNDASITEAKLSLSDVTTRDASTTAHGLLRKLSGTATQYLDGSGAWTTPAGGMNYWSRGGAVVPSYYTGLLAWWRLEEASGTRLDSVGSLALVPQGTVASLTSAAGKTGSALAMDGTFGAYCSLADTPTMSVGVSTSFTIACWVYIGTAPGTNQWGFVGKGNVSSTQNTCEYHWFMGSSTFHFVVGNGSSRVDRAYPGVTVTAGQWYFLLGWWDAGTLSLQINNGTVDSSAWAAGSYDSTLPFEVGRQLGYHDARSYFNGRVDNIMFWRRALTTQERTDIWNGGASVEYVPSPTPYLTPVTPTDRLVLAAATTTQERLEVDGAVKLGTTTGTTDGTLRWSGTDFEGRKAGAWASLTGAGGQPLDATLTALAGLPTAADRVPYFTGVDTAALTTFTAAGRTLAGAADAAAQRTTLGLGTLGQQDASAVAIAGGSATFTGNVVAGERARDSQYGFASTLQAAGGTDRYAIKCVGDAPTSLGGTLYVAARVGIGAQPNANVRMTIEYLKDSMGGITFHNLISDAGALHTVYFTNVAGGTVGSINATATATAYNTSSDARLKRASTPLTGALDVIAALRPVKFRWTVDDSPGHGFLAHELQREIPDAVTGEPDAVGPQGEIVPQQVDHSRLVPWLTACCQELAAQVQALAVRVASLEQQLGV